MTKNIGLAVKLIFFILTTSAIIFIAAFLYNYHFSRQMVLKNIEESAKNLAYSTVYKIETVLQSVEKVPRNLASFIENTPYEHEDLLQIIRGTVANNDELYGSTFAFEPYAFDPDRYYFAPYFYKNNGTIQYVLLGSDSYRYFYLDWYQIPKELGRPVWSEPYYDEGGGNIIMSTFSVPFYTLADNDKTFRGVITADISLTWLQEMVSSVKIYKTGYAFVISHNGDIITHPKEQLIMRESIFSIAEAKNDPSLREIGRQMIQGTEGFVPLTDFVSGNKSWMYCAPLPSSGWSLGVIFPEAELFADIRRLSTSVIIIGMIGFSLLTVAIVIVSRTITRPITSLARSTAEIAKGNLDIHLPEHQSNDEVGELTSSFRDMKSALKEYIANLAETTAAKERIESELKIARSIQLSFLPKHFPPFPEKVSFELFATLESAKEIGGDLYDFYLLDDNHLFFVVGDVSDKGIPAALFMAVTKTLMKGMAEPDKSPAHILDRVNQELCLDNESNMFVTVFCGIVELSTGILTYSNAGHNPPIILGSAGTAEWLTLPEGFFLGVFEEARYLTSSIVLQPGDTLLAYTDGVTEAVDRDDRFYGTDHLMNIVEQAGTQSAENLVKTVMNSVEDFARGVSQSDDITVLALRFKGSGRQ